MHPSTRSRIVAHLRAQWAGLLALFLVVAGGTAYAVDTVGSSDIINESIQSEDLKNGEVKTPDLANNQVQSADVRDDTLANGGLAGVDIKNQSGVDTCTHGTARFGELCVVDTNASSNWQGAQDTCKALELRVPSLGEAQAVAAHHSIPNLAPGDFFWTEEFYTNNNGTPPDFLGWTVSGNGVRSNQSFMTSAEVVCVTTPTN